MSKTAAKTTPQANIERLLPTAPQSEKRATTKQDQRKKREEDTQVVSDTDAPQGGDVIVAAAPAASEAPMVLAQTSTAAAETSTAAAGAAAAPAVSGWVIGLAALGGLALAANSGSSSATTPTTTPASISGTAIDGYLVGAKVYLVDASGNKTDTGETTDANGKFTIQNPNGYVIQIEGGTNADTGLANTVVLKAPAATEGSIVVTPLTTVIQTMMAKNGLTIAQAEAKLQAALGITGDIDLLTLDSIATSNLDVQKANVQIATALTLTASGDEAQDVLVALATQINASSGAVDLTQELVTSLSAAPSIDQTTLANISTSLNAIAQAASLTAIADAQEAAVSGPPPFALAEADGVVTFSNATDPITFTVDANGVATFKSGSATATGTISDFGNKTIELAADQTMEINPAAFVSGGALIDTTGFAITGEGTFSLKAASPVDMGTSLLIENVQPLIVQFAKATNWSTFIASGDLTYSLDESFDYWSLGDGWGPNAEQYLTMALASNFSNPAGDYYFGLYDLVDTISNLIAFAGKFPELYVANESWIGSRENASIAEYAALSIAPAFSADLADTAANMMVNLRGLFENVQANSGQYPWTHHITGSGSDDTDTINAAVTEIYALRDEFSTDGVWIVYDLHPETSSYTFDLNALHIDQIYAGEGTNDSVTFTNANATHPNTWSEKAIQAAGFENVVVDIDADTTLDYVQIKGNQTTQSDLHYTINAGADFAVTDVNYQWGGSTQVDNRTGGSTSIEVTGTGQVNLGNLNGSVGPTPVLIDASTNTGGLTLVLDGLQYREYKNGYWTSGDASLSVVGSQGDDYIVGGWGDDSIAGGQGSDVLRGGGGADTLTGGEGADTFVFSDTSQSEGTAITDFETGIDKIKLVLYSRAAQDGTVATPEISFGTNNTNWDASYNSETKLFNLEMGNGRSYSIESPLAINAGDFIVDFVLQGDGSSNTMAGGVGDDVFYGQGGKDIMDGGVGNDTFYYQDSSHTSKASDLANADVIKNISAGDQIIFEGMNLDNAKLLSQKSTSLSNIGLLDATDDYDIWLGTDGGKDYLVFESGWSFDYDRVIQLEYSQGFAADVSKWTFQNGVLTIV